MSQLYKIEVMDEIQDLVFDKKPYQSLTKGIEISVWPEYVDGKRTALGEIFIWAYQVRIENRNKFSLKLISRYWRIIDEFGELQEVKGEGVVGEQPVILANQSYQYSSGVHLRCPSGIMSGYYKMKNLENDDEFEVEIPTFSLDVPEIKNILN
ncbi:protein ApaG [Alphaproteobacteria bacterium]|nr:protein ApaG [Alphaproteobacteria bacterium]